MGVFNDAYYSDTLLIDIAVGAPYERSSVSQNTGAVYIYYGSNTKESFKVQIPQWVSKIPVVAAWPSYTPAF